MSEDKTARMNGRSFEERVFARFDALDSSLKSVDARLESVELRLANVETRLDNVETRLASVETRLDNVETRLASVETRLDNVEIRLASVETRLGNVEIRLDHMETRLEKLEARQYDTKPIWERALREIAELRNEMQTGFEKLRIELDDGLRKATSYIDALNKSILEIRGELHYFDRRIEKLESNAS